MALPPRWFLRNRIKLRQLQLVSVLGEAGNLRKAAAELAMTQPTATRLLREVETALGVELFERSRRGMAPTLYGAAMIRDARVLLSDLDALHDGIRALADGATGTLAIGAMTSTASVVLPRSVAALAARHPQLRMSIQEGTHDMLIAALKRGELDLMLGRVMGGAQLDDLDVEVLYHDDFRVVCGPQHPLARAKKLTLQALAGERWILPPPSAPLRQRFDILFAAAAGSRPRNALESVSLLSNLTLLQEAPMLGVMPADIARRFERQGTLRILPVALADLFGPVALVTRARRPRTPAMEALIAELRLAAASTSPQERRLSPPPDARSRASRPRGRPRAP
jgi:DNA-binding transcriptional LysR family regulator